MLQGAWQAEVLQFGAGSAGVCSRLRSADANTLPMTFARITPRFHIWAPLPKYVAATAILTPRHSQFLGFLYDLWCRSACVGYLETKASRCPSLGPSLHSLPAYHAPQRRAL